MICFFDIAIFLTPHGIFSIIRRDKLLVETVRYSFIQIKKGVKK